jgi:2-polyprenyl-3-methyl-5-hydroxy-6-metoxy-1,4-benzoquinol methylase
MLAESETARRDALAERLFAMALGAYELFAVHLGDRLGLYRALADGEAVTPGELAASAGIGERYAREWLEQQAVAGILEVEDGRFRLPAGHAETLTDPESLAYTTPMARFAAVFGAVLPALEEAFRTGGGVDWEVFGDLAREAQAEANRPVFTHLLAAEWLPALPDVHARLSAGPARIADVACGAGWSSIAMARAYPEVAVDGYDLDEPSIEAARANAAEAGLADRVRFHVRDAGDPELAGSYQLVTAFEAIHDLSNPVAVLGAMRALAADDGAVLVVDERVAETFQAPGDEVERIMYTYSILCCLPAGLADTPSAATGTVMRPDTLRRYAEEAGFASLEILPVEHDVFRLYRLHP